MERTETQNMENLNKITSNIEKLTTLITDGFSFLRQMIQQHIHNMPRYYTQAQGSAYAYARIHTPPHSQSHTVSPPASATTSQHPARFSYRQTLFQDDIELIE